jgi:hypothetical protein
MPLHPKKTVTKPGARALPRAKKPGARALPGLKVSKKAYLKKAREYLAAEGRGYNLEREVAKADARKARVAHETRTLPRHKEALKLPPRGVHIGAPSFGQIVKGMPGAYKQIAETASRGAGRLAGTAVKGVKVALTPRTKARKRPPIVRAVKAVSKSILSPSGGQYTPKARKDVGVTAKKLAASRAQSEFRRRRAPRKGYRPTKR